LGISEGEQGEKKEEEGQGQEKWQEERGRGGNNKTFKEEA